VNTDYDFEQLHLRTRRRRRIAKRRNRRESEVSQQMLFFVIFVPSWRILIFLIEA